MNFELVFVIAVSGGLGYVAGKYLNVIWLALITAALILYGLTWPTDGMELALFLVVLYWVLVMPFIGSAWLTYIIENDYDVERWVEKIFLRKQ